MKCLIRKGAVIQVGVTRTIYELETTLSSAHEPHETTSGELQGRLEEHYQILQREIGMNIKELVDDENLEEELGGVGQYEVFIYCMKAKVARFPSRAQITSDPATVPTTIHEVDRSRNAIGDVALPRLEVK